MNYIERYEHWKNLVERWEKEGGTRREFCDRHDLKYTVFLYWVRRLRGPHVETPDGDSITCIELTPRTTINDEDLVFEADGIRTGIAGRDATVVIRGELSVAQLRNIVEACGAGYVSS